MRSIFLCSVPSDDVLACFRAGGGVPYARFERFHEVMAEDSDQTVLPVLKSHILPLVLASMSGLRTASVSWTSAVGGAGR